MEQEDKPNCDCSGKCGFCRLSFTNCEDFWRHMGAVHTDSKPEPIPTDWTGYIADTTTRNAFLRLIQEINDRL